MAVLSVISLILGIILSCFGLWQRFRTGRERLEAQVTRESFKMPVDVEDLLNRYHRLVTKEIEEKLHPKEYVSLDPWTFRNELEVNLNRAIAQANTCWTIRIDNLTKKKAIEVSVKVPDRIALAKVQRGHDVLVVNHDQGQIRVGDMMPQDTVQMTVWTDGF